LLFNFYIDLLVIVCSCAGLYHFFLSSVVVHLLVYYFCVSFVFVLILFFFFPIVCVSSLLCRSACVCFFISLSFSCVCLFVSSFEKKSITWAMDHWTDRLLPNSTDLKDNNISKKPFHFLPLTFKTHTKTHSLSREREIGVWMEWILERRIKKRLFWRWHALSLSLPPPPTHSLSVVNECELPNI
jgi:hypothetical protein